MSETDKIDGSVSASKGTLKSDIAAAPKGSEPTAAEEFSIERVFMDPRLFDPELPISTGYTALDAALCGGFHFGGMYILSGVTGEGKSTLVQNIACRVAERGIKTTIFSLEDTPNHLVRKLVAANSKVGIKQITGEYSLSEDEYRRVDIVKNWIQKLPLRINNKADSIQVLQKAIDIEHSRGVQLFIVDQSSCVEVPDSKSEYETHSKLSKALKQVSKDKNMIIIVVTQVNRIGVSKKADGGEIGQNHIRSSDTWGHDAYGIIMLKHVNKGPEEIAEMKLAVTKHRYGVGFPFEFSLAFYKSWQRIDDWTKELEDAKPAAAIKDRKLSGEEIAKILIDCNGIKTQPQTAQQVLLSASGCELSSRQISAFLDAVKGTRSVEQHSLAYGIFALQNSGGIRAKWYFATDLAALKANYNH